MSLGELYIMIEWRNDEKCVGHRVSAYIINLHVYIMNIYN